MSPLAIRLEGVHFAYADPWGRPRPVLEGVDLAVDDGESVAVVGATGSGKTTLVQLMAGLLRPTRGRVTVDGQPVEPRRGTAAHLRGRVGLVFQHPEHQLFAETVFEDVAFGPRNLGLGPEEVERRVAAAMAAVGLPAELASRSPFSLSGGQMRRVAIAGVLAMAPRHLILDEPTAALDAAGRRALVEELGRLRRGGMTLVVVTHEMELAAQLARRVVVLHRGRIAADGPPGQVFALPDLPAWGLVPPAGARLLAALRAGGLPVRADALTLEEACRRVARALGGGEG